MATKSVLKMIHIKRKGNALSLVRALENASGKQAKEVHFQRPYSSASKDDIIKMFGDGVNNDRV